MRMTTRPELRGGFGMVASSHWIASGVGMGVLERGGNAFDAAVAAGLTLQVVLPHLNGPGGEVPAVFWSADRGEPLVLCGQGVAPQRATIAAYQERGHDLIPGVGLLAACVPGAFDGWMLLLREFGTWRLKDVAEMAIHYADHGFPVTTSMEGAIRAAEPGLRDWPGSAEIYLPAPAAGERFRNRDLAATYRRIVTDASGGTREHEIDRAREIFYNGFVAEALHNFSEQNEGLLTGDDLATWRASLEPPIRYDFYGRTICKPGPWSQGPVFLQQLALLEGLGLEALELGSVEYVHTVIECAKLAFADRDAFYGDPEFVDVPLARLLSRSYNDERRPLVDETASYELRPGGGRLPPSGGAGRSGAGAGEPTRAVGAGEPTRGDTVHLDVADRYGNVVSVTPSGGWLQSSPTVPDLGFPLGTRAQMFWLDEHHPNALAPGKRPRTTLSPSLATQHGEPRLAFGTPGGDQQDQWSLAFFLAHALFGRNLQEAIDEPAFHTEHLVSSFYPRQTELGAVEAEARLGPAVIAGLRERGHDVRTEPEWALGYVTAAGRQADGQLVAGASPRGMHAYACGR
jgi:gamma-glutamyltranspeptidase/glutathione hydrolase